MFLGHMQVQKVNYKFLTSNHENVELILEIVHGDSTWKQHINK